MKYPASGTEALRTNVRAPYGDGGMQRYPSACGLALDTPCSVHGMFETSSKRLARIHRERRDAILAKRPAERAAQLSAAAYARATADSSRRVIDGASR